MHTTEKGILFIRYYMVRTRGFHNSWKQKEALHLTVQKLLGGSRLGQDLIERYEFKIKKTENEGIKQTLRG